MHTSFTAFVWNSKMQQNEDYKTLKVGDFLKTNNREF